MKTKTKDILPIIGWREWVELPELEIRHIKVKVDSGARSSSLNAVDVHPFEKNGEQWVRFKVHPLQRSIDKTVAVEAQVLEYRNVRSSSGHTRKRPVIVTDVILLGKRWPVELTLANREDMSFRMLLGREAFRGRFLVDGGKSYYAGKPEMKKRRRGGSAGEGGATR